MSAIRNKKSSDNKPEKNARGMYGNTDSDKVCGQGCEKKHQLSWCPKFKKLPVSKKKSAVIQAKLCFKCLEPGHRLDDCKKDY